MLWNVSQGEGIASARVTCTIRKWKRPQARVGGVYDTPGGHIRVSSVEVVPFDEVTTADLVAAGFSDHDELADVTRAHASDDMFVVHFERVDVAPKADLGADDRLSDDDVADLRRRLDRMDARSPVGPWTRATLAIIAAQPATRAIDLAATLGRERLPFKADVRKLKALGLTRSLERGYELSPRGQAFLGRH